MNNDIIYIIISLAIILIIGISIIILIDKLFFKKCPYCNESISKKAIRCKYCHKDLN